MPLPSLKLYAATKPVAGVGVGGGVPVGVVIGVDDCVGVSVGAGVSGGVGVAVAVGVGEGVGVGAIMPASILKTQSLSPTLLLPGGVKARVPVLGNPVPMLM